jgi:iron-sulfur cluster repair protein YtfE (RIC family)
MADRSADAPAVVETRVVHDTHRRATSLLADTAASDGGAPAGVQDALRDLVVTMLRHHHRSEDQDLWPTIVTAFPAVTDQFDELSREHDRLDEALDRLAADTTPASTAEVRDLLHEHLDHEEPILFPVLRTHVTDAQWTAFSERTVASSPKDRTDLLVALCHEVAPDQDVALLLRHLPPEAKAGVPALRTAGEQILDALRRVTR